MTYRSTVLALSPSALWMLDETSGTVAADATGNGRHGAYVGSPALGATSILHDGSSSGAMQTAFHAAGVMSVASASWMNGSTVSAVIRTKLTSAFDSGNGDAVFTRYSGVFPWLLWRNTGGAWSTQINAAINCNGAAVTVSQEYTVGFTYDGSNIRLYVDGVKVATVAYSTALATGSAPIEVGRYSGTSVTTPGGSHSGAAVWVGTVLSDADMAVIHTAAITTPSIGTITLSGSGAGAGGAGGSGSLSLSGSGAAKASASGAGAIALSGSGIIDFQPAAGSGSIALSGAGATGVGVSGSGAIALSGAGTAVGATAASGSGDLTLSGAGFATLAAGGSGSITLGAVGTAFALFITDMTNAMNGRRRRGRGTATVGRAIAPLPPGRTYGVRYDKAIALPTPDMVDGRPT